MSTENKTKLNESLLAAFNRVVNSKSNNLFAEAKKLNEISDTEIMNSDLYKNALKGRDPNKIQIGDEIEGLGKFEKGETIWSKTKAALAAKKAAPENPVIEPNKKIPEFNVKQSVPGATPAPGPTGGYNTDRKPSDNSWVQDSAAAPASNTSTITTTTPGGEVGVIGNSPQNQAQKYADNVARVRAVRNVVGEPETSRNATDYSSAAVVGNMGTNTQASTTTAIPTNNKSKLTGDGGMTGTAFSATDRQNLEFDRNKANDRLKRQRAGLLPGTGL